MSNQNEKKNNRRNFLRTMLTAGGTAGLLTPLSKTPKSKTTDKIKMLTADGKLVEIKKSVIEKQAALKRASDKEVFEWMDKKDKG